MTFCFLCFPQTAAWLLPCTWQSNAADSACPSLYGRPINSQGLYFARDNSCHQPPRDSCKRQSGLCSDFEFMLEAILQVRCWTCTDCSKIKKFSENPRQTFKHTHGKRRHIPTSQAPLLGIGGGFSIVCRCSLRVCRSIGFR